MSETVGPYVLVRTLGEGASGKVKLGVHNETGQTVAIKILKKAALTQTPQLRRRVEREITVMKLIDHPHVLRLFDVLQSSRYLFLILEYAEGGELFEYLVKHNRLTVDEAFVFFRQIVQGLEYCHKNLICHRDLKPENLLLDKDKNIKIADFGMASIIKEETLLETSCGSPHYASPEVVKGEKYNGYEADVWSLGVILYALICGKLPFDDDNMQKLLHKVKNGQYSIPENIPEDVKDMIASMMHVVPSSRIRVVDIKKHPWWVDSEKRLFLNTSNPSSDTKENSGTKTVQEEAQSHNESNISTSPSDSSDTPKSPQFKPNELDEEVIDKIRQMGWNDVQQLKHSLVDPSENIEKVMYRLILKRKQNNQNTYYPVQIENKGVASVSISSPIIDDEKNILDDSFTRRPVTPSDHPPRKLSWFSQFMKKKDDNENMAIGIHLAKTRTDAVNTLDKVFQRLSIQTETPVANITTNLKAFYMHDKSKVEFDVEIKDITSAIHIITFTKISGDNAIIRVLFDDLQRMLSE